MIRVLVAGLRYRPAAARHEAGGTRYRAFGDQLLTLLGVWMPMVSGDGDGFAATLPPFSPRASLLSVQV